MKYIFTDQHRRNISAGKTGKKQAPEHTEKIALSNRGKKHGPMSQEHRRKIGDAFRGKKLSEDHKSKLSAAMRGRKKSESAIRKMAESKRGKKATIKHIEKMSVALRGVKKTTPAGMAAPSHHKSKEGVLRDAHGRVWPFRNYRDFVRANPQLFNEEDILPKQRIQNGRISYWCRAEKGIASLFKKGKRVPGTWKGWTVAFSIMERAEGGGDLLGRECATVVELAK